MSAEQITDKIIRDLRPNIFLPELNELKAYNNKIEIFKQSSEIFLCYIKKHTLRTETEL